ncbi:hypothetical protein [Brevibacterium sediminis]
MPKIGSGQLFRLGHDYTIGIPGNTPTEPPETVSAWVHTRDGGRKIVMSVHSEDEKEPTKVPEEAKGDVAEKPGTDSASKQHEDELVDEWEEESFPASDPPAHY